MTKKTPKERAEELAAQKFPLPQEAWGSPMRKLTHMIRDTYVDGYLQGERNALESLDTSPQASADDKKFILRFYADNSTPLNARVHAASFEEAAATAKEMAEEEGTTVLSVGELKRAIPPVYEQDPPAPERRIAYRYRLKNNTGIETVMAADFVDATNLVQEKALQDNTYIRWIERA